MNDFSTASLPDSLFSGETPEEIRHEKLKFLEGHVIQLAASTSDKLQVSGAKEQLRYGLLVRLSMMQTSRIEIRERTIEQEKPLGSYLLTELSIHLNAFYLNLVGALDNLAWTLAYELSLRDDLDEDNFEHQRFCTFSNSKFRLSLVDSSSIAESLLSEAAEWIRDVKRFRNPAAHRLPLQIVGQILLEEDMTQFNELNRQAMEALENGDLFEYFNRKGEANRVGRFMPLLHAPTSPSGQSYIVPNQMADDQERFLAFARYMITQCLLSE